MSVIMGGMELAVWQLAERYWDGVLAAAPSEATQLGDHRFDDRVDDLSLTAESDNLNASGALLREVDALDVGRLEARDRVTHALLRAEIARILDYLACRPKELAYDHMAGVHAMALTYAPQTVAAEPAHATALLARYRQFDSMLAQAAGRFRDGLAAGRSQARVSVERSLAQLDAYLASPLTDDPFATITGPTDWPATAAWRDELARIVGEVVRPAFARYRDMIAVELLPAARGDDRAGLCWLGDDGTDMYHRLVRYHTTLPDSDADAIHELGLSEIDRLTGEYATIGQRLFGTGDLGEVFARLRADPALRYRHADDILTDARDCLDRASAAAPRWFRRLPTRPCQIVPVPDFLSPDSPAAYYYPPAADGSRPGIYYVNQYQPGTRLRYETAAVAFHEAIPGHHLQLAIASELEHLPRFQRLSYTNTAFVEGWGLYAERLADEMGLYTDDLDRIGMLAGDSLRSARLVVDTGLHAKGWSRRQAIDYMIAHTPAAPEEISVEVDRYIAAPAQALAYKIGQLEIQHQRQLATERLGDRFDIAAFHDQILAHGALNLTVLREQVATGLSAPPDPR
ncbi:DUF885 domain-containing protein [Nocardia nova]|uniref:DUF885 domain-containing protein n=1 Tax=Nocardia nova TaxID=37330 RepID=UPI0033E9E42E